ncbi:MAG: glycosyltransferase [Kofleriaceae bacterium]|nr:glycosyltransferase [Kofleriaceae bacterium]
MSAQAQDLPSPPPLPRGQIVLATVKPEITRAGVAGQVDFVEVRSSLGSASSLTAVVVAYQETESLLELLRTLRATRGASDEVVLVDNGLSPEVVAAARPLVDTYVRCRGNLGCSQGRNVGAAYARGPLLAFIDADAGVGDGYLEACHRAMSDPTRLAVRGRVLPRRARGVLPSHYDLGDAPGLAPISTEGASVWRAEPFRRAGGFEASLYGREGPVLCYRMHLLQQASVGAFAYEPAIVLLHDYGTSGAHLWRKLVRNARIVDQVDRAYPLMRDFLRRFPPLGGPRAAAPLIRLRSQAARWQVKLAPDPAHASPLALAAGSVVVGPHADAGAARCLEEQTLRCQHRYRAGDPPRADGAEPPWYLFVTDELWLDPTLVERISNTLLQHPEARAVRTEPAAGVAALRTPLARPLGELATTTGLLAELARMAASGGVVSLPPVPVLVRARPPVQARLQRLVRAMGRSR